MLLRNPIFLCFFSGGGGGGGEGGGVDGHPRTICAILFSNPPISF